MVNVVDAKGWPADATPVAAAVGSMCCQTVRACSSASTVRGIAKPRSGYRVIFVPFANGQPCGKPIEVLGGLEQQNGDAFGRPVGVALDRTGARLVADDVGNVVWRVSSR